MPSKDLDDERLMRLRLERLLCWRESPERWSTYQHMLPVLILARSPRQCDHWQRAVESAALKLRLNPPSGALACLPQPEDRQINPWRLAWRTLSTDVPCHLQHLLRPLPRTALPPSLRLEEDEDEAREARATSDASAASASPGTPVRLKRLIMGDLTGRAAGIMQERQEEPEVMALGSLRLTPRQWAILRLLLAHPLLSDDELGAFLTLQRKSVRCSLYGLHQLDYLQSILTEVGKRWQLCERGLRLLATANHLHVRTLAAASDNEGDGEVPRSEQRGAAWLLRHIRHTAGIYGFFAALSRAASREPEQALCWWETGAVCERRYRVGEQWHNLRPDALAAYRAGPQHFRFWFEWDRGTMNARDLAVKFEAYEHYVASRDWAREFASVPGLMCVAPDIAQERRMQRAGQASLTHTPGLVLWSTTEVLLNEYGPLAPVWVQSSPARDHAAQSGNPARQRLFDTSG